MDGWCQRSIEWMKNKSQMCFNIFFYKPLNEEILKSIYIFSNSLFHEKGLAGLKFSIAKLLGWKRPPEIKKMKMLAMRTMMIMMMMMTMMIMVMMMMIMVMMMTSVVAEPLGCTLHRPLLSVVPDRFTIKSKQQIYHYIWAANLDYRAIYINANFTWVWMVNFQLWLDNWINLHYKFWLNLNDKCKRSNIDWSLKCFTKFGI